MANEIKTSISVTLANGSLKDNVATDSVNITQTNQELFAPVVVVGTSEEDLPMTDITNPGVIYVKNLDSTNFVKYGPKNGSNVMQEFGRLKPGESALFRLAPSAVTLRWIADTAPVKVQVKLYGN